MLQNAISRDRGMRYPIAETLWILAGIVLLLAFGDALTLLVLAFASVTIAATWWVHGRVQHRMASTGRTVVMLVPLVLGATALAAALSLAAPAQAAAIDNRFDICAALRNGTSLASIETTLEARGYSATNAGAFTGTTIRQQCPDQAAGVMAQLSRQHS